MKRFRVMVRDRKGGTPEVLEAFEAKTKDDAVARLNLAGMAVESIYEVEGPKEPKLPSRLLAKVRAGALRAWGKQDVQGKVFLVGIPLLGLLFFLNAVVPESEEAKRERAHQERLARDSAAMPVRSPDAQLPLLKDERAAGEVWRTGLNLLVPGDVVAPGVRIDTFAFYVLSVTGDGARCRAEFTVTNNTGNDVYAGNLMTAVVDEAGMGVWKSDARRLHTEPGTAQLKQDVFVPPLEWKRAKTFSVLFMPAQR